MHSSHQFKLFASAWVVTSSLLFIVPSGATYAQTENPTTETTNMTVVVKDYDTGEPLSQAHVTLQFSVPRSQAVPRKPKQVSYSAKTDAQGRCKLAGINKGPIVLTITADGRQAYGKELKLERDNQVFEVRMKKPQPLI